MKMKVKTGDKEEDVDKNGPNVSNSFHFRNEQSYVKSRIYTSGFSRRRKRANKEDENKC